MVRLALRYQGSATKLGPVTEDISPPPVTYLYIWVHRARRTHNKTQFGNPIPTTFIPLLKTCRVENLSHIHYVLKLWSCLFYHRIFFFQCWELNTGLLCSHVVPQSYTSSLLKETFNVKMKYLGISEDPKSQTTVLH